MANGLEIFIGLVVAFVLLWMLGKYLCTTESGEVICWIMGALNDAMWWCLGAVKDMWQTIF
jgi:hypothetical protein